MDVVDDAKVRLAAGLSTAGRDMAMEVRVGGAEFLYIRNSEFQIFVCLLKFL